jgi:hypothetical protein
LFHGRLVFADRPAERHESQGKTSGTSHRARYVIRQGQSAKFLNDDKITRCIGLMLAVPASLFAGKTKPRR